MNQLNLGKIERNREASKKWATKFRKKNPEEYRKKWKKYQDDNREKINQRLCEKRKNDPEYRKRVNKQNREFYKRNREKVKQAVRNWNQNGILPEMRKNFYYNYLVQVGCWFEGCKIDDPEILEFHHVEKKLSKRAMGNVTRISINELIKTELQNGFPTCPTHHVLWHLCYGRKRPWRSRKKAREILEQKRLNYTI